MWRLIWWIRRLPFRVRTRWQKLTRGYSDLEIWNLDDTIVRWLEPRIRALVENLHSAPTGYPATDFVDLVTGQDLKTDHDQWREDLLALADTLKVYAERRSGQRYTTIAEENQADEELRQRLHWMADWFGGLWD